MEGITFERQFRTPYSEGYAINKSEDRLGRVDLHYASEVVYGTLIVETDISEDDISDLIEQIDDQLVLTADVERDDFQITVFQGKEVGFYSDDYSDEDEDAENEAEED
jgi:hypothetical protein